MFYGAGLFISIFFFFTLFSTEFSYLFSVFFLDGIGGNGSVR